MIGWDCQPTRQDHDPLQHGESRQLHTVLITLATRFWTQIRLNIRSTGGIAFPPLHSSYHDATLSTHLRDTPSLFEEWPLSMHDVQRLVGTALRALCYMAQGRNIVTNTSEHLEALSRDISGD
jgi:hypothetical protein